MAALLVTSKPLKAAIIAFSLLLFSTAGLGSSAVAAGRIYAAYGAFERSVAINQIAKFALTGKVDGLLADYAHELNREQLARLRRLLTTQINLSPVAVSQFLYSPIGETLLRRLGQIIQTEAGLSGFYAIRAALILAAADQQQGFTLLNVLRQFPTNGIRIDLGQSLDIVEELQQLVERTQQAVISIEQQSTAAALGKPPVNFFQRQDIRQSGSFSWTKRTLTLYDRQRDRTFVADLYLPQNAEDRRQQFRSSNSEFRIPVIVISHGLGSDRNSFEYLAQHLASYSFAVAVPEHPNSNSQQLRSLLAGRADVVSQPSEFIYRPLDVSYLLDVLEQLDRDDPSFALNLNQVGVVGHSFGGYTALALAGADLNFDQLQQDCANLDDVFNLSLLLQCRALELRHTEYNLRDKRVKAAIAINPIVSSISGRDGLSQIQIPVTIVSSSADKVAPALPEQIQPFTWLNAKEKYLVLLAGETHFSAAGQSQKTEPLPLPAALIGPEPKLARRYIQALSVAFFETYVAGSKQYRPYLSADYAQAISQPPLELNLVQSLPINISAQIGN
jgi:predicted dienelactone hydrolase